MATQGLVSIVDGNQVIFKIVTGSDGYNASKVVEALRGLKVAELTTEFIYRLAKRVGFGSECSLVVLGKEKQVFTEVDEDLNPLYFDTFHNPTFNPRWECGLADYSEILVVKKDGSL